MVRFITFEGGDGTGKTTQIRALGEYLSAKGRLCLLTREPGGTPLGELIRKVLLEAGDRQIVPPAELFLYLADRAQHVGEVIRPAIESGKIVLSDRFTDSTVAYQGYGRGIDLGLLRKLNDVADQGCRPDLTFLLDCPVEAGLARTARRGLEAKRPSEDRFEREGMKFHEKVRAGFLEMARAEPKRFRVIDALRSIDEIALEIRTIVDRELD
ncbi:MAG TPA: dTMP kinase [Candidatus Binatia bacterium]|nr:dTMP kinase [Candidatus Binatia bacterium]